MFRRICRLPARQSCFLFGPRQTGKSTLVGTSLPRDAWRVDLLSQQTFLSYARHPAQFRREAEARIRAGTRTIFIDEVQKLPPLLDEVHALIESTGTRFVLTGSSARKLRRGAANLLAGRAVTRHLHPLVAQEMGADFSLERVLRYGSLPPAVTLAEDEARELLRSYAETYLREEIQAEALVRNIGAFARFLDVVAAESGEIVNMSALSREAAIAVRTVQDYYQILEDTLIGFRLPGWRRSPRARTVAHPKVYLFDLGVLNALARRLGNEIDPALRGRLFEHFVVLETRRLLDYLDPDARLHFWRTNHGAEVDLLIERAGKLQLAIEIKAKERVEGADLSGLRSFSEEHPKVPRIVVSLVSRPYLLDGNVRVLPYRAFLDEAPWVTTRA